MNPRERERERERGGGGGGRRKRVKLFFSAPKFTLSNSVWEIHYFVFFANKNCSVILYWVKLKADFVTVVTGRKQALIG